MKSAIFKVGILALSLTIGVVACLFFANRRSHKPAVPSIGNQPSTKCADPVYKGGYLVISVPNDDECYIGKQKVELPQISASVRQWLRNVDFCDRVVFIKAASQVRLETLAQIERQARDADVYRVEFILDKRKRGGKN
jgi:biopolymer transport protein ExbD